MYEAELKGKVSSFMKRKEDILTSNVFSFFKYSNRIIFLKGFLNKFDDIKVDDNDVKNARFKFWPTLSDNTEPDLVIIVGDYYLLIEAKYHSDFGKANDIRKSQLNRELEEGRLEAKNLNKIFKLITITADYYYKQNKFITIENKECFIWTNWQKIASFIYEILETTNKLNNYEIVFANDLYDLLVNKNLREYRGIKYFNNPKINIKSKRRLFFKAGTAKFRGGFIGFKESLTSFDFNIQVPKYFFVDQQNKFFSSLVKLNKINKRKTDIFFKEVY